MSDDAEFEKWLADLYTKNAAANAAEAELFRHLIEFGLLVDEAVAAITALSRLPPPSHGELVERLEQWAEAFESRGILEMTVEQVTIENGESPSEDLRAAATALRQQEGWATIDSAPDDGRIIWVFGGRYGVPDITQADGGWWRQMAAESKIVPTHWREFIRPAAPGDSHG